MISYQFGDPIAYIGSDHRLVGLKFSFLKVDEKDPKYVHIACEGKTDLDSRVPFQDVLPRGWGADGPAHPPGPAGYVDGNPKTRAGAMKPSFHAIPPAALMALGMVMALGEKKYGLFNWREFPVTASTYLDAAERHLLEFRDGETFDRESRVTQLAHVMACCAIVIDAMANGVITDDRTKFPGAASDLIKAISEGQPNAICEPR